MGQDEHLFEKALQKIRDALSKIGRSFRLPDADKLPWRRGRSPYKTLIAEMLLVRTRYDVVSRIFDELVLRYPDVFALAEADEADLAELLRPLGLKKRVPFILRAARYIIEVFEGKIPDDPNLLKQIPGVGDYTAAAVAAFGFGRALLPADVNILRFFARYTGLDMGHPTKGSPLLRNLIRKINEEGLEVNPELVLDFSRTICRARKPKCSFCPLMESCEYVLLHGRIKHDHRPNLAEKSNR